MSETFDWQFMLIFLAPFVGIFFGRMLAYRAAGRRRR